MRADTAVLVFGKSPVPGQVKTRLVPGLSMQQASVLYERMLAHALAVAAASALGPVSLCAHPDACARLRAMARRHAARTAPQVGSDLGARMQHALHDALSRHPRALLIGSDCPALTAGTLRAADRVLREAQAPVVLVPAVDGGYVLVGGCAVCPAMFQDMPWGGRDVMMLTRVRLLEAGWSWHELPPLRDVDRIQDLDLLPPAFGDWSAGAKILT